MAINDFVVLLPVDKVSPNSGLWPLHKIVSNIPFPKNIQVDFSFMATTNLSVD